MANTKLFNQVYDAAIAAGLTPSAAQVTAAQAMLETGWGKSIKGNNIFGVKAGSSWTGKTQDLKTWEGVDGKQVRITDKFRAYDTIEEAIADRVALMDRRWPGFNQAQSIDEAYEKLKIGKSGAYATDGVEAGDPLTYIEKLESVSRRAGKPVPPGRIPGAGDSLAEQRAEQDALRNRDAAPPLPRRRPDGSTPTVLTPDLPARRPETVGGVPKAPVTPGGTVLTGGLGGRPTGFVALPAGRSAVPAGNPSPVPAPGPNLQVAPAPGKAASALDAPLSPPDVLLPASGRWVDPTTGKAVSAPAARSSVPALGKTAAQIAQEADNARLSGYREIQEMGPSSKGAKPNAVATPVVVKKPGAIKTTAPDQQPIPKGVVPQVIVGGSLTPKPTSANANLNSARAEQRSALTNKAPVAGLTLPVAPADAAKANRLAAGAAAAAKASAAQVAAQRAAQAQAARAAEAKARSTALAAARAAQARQQAAAAATARAAAMARLSPAGVAASTPGIGHTYSTVAHAGERTDVFGNDQAFNTRSQQTSDRWNTGY